MCHLVFQFLNPHDYTSKFLYFIISFVLYKLTIIKLNLRPSPYLVVGGHGKSKNTVEAFQIDLLSCRISLN